MEMLLGKVAGPMGATNALVVCACLLYLIVRRTVHWQAPVCFLLTCALYAYPFPRVAISSWLSVMYELFSGYLILGAIFMLTDPVTSPKRAIATALYAVFAGGVTMLFRQFGGFEESFAFSLLLCNAVAPVFDYLEERIRHQIRRRQRAKI